MGFRVSHLFALGRAYNAGRRRHRLLPAGHAFPLELQSDCRIGLRWHGGDSHGHHHHLGEGAEADRVFRMGLAADVALSVGKALTGYVSGSTAIVADAAHSVSDIVLSSVAWWSFRAAKAPRDREHPYGHGKFETLGALGISGMLLATAGGIGWHTIDVLQGLLMSTPDMINHSLEHGHHNHGHGGHHHGIDLDHPVLALSMTVISISVKEGLYWITKRAGEREGSGLMKANAWHHRADAVSSVVALVGVGIGNWFKKNFKYRVLIPCRPFVWSAWGPSLLPQPGGAILGVPYLDPLAGLVVSGMIVKAGIDTGYQSVMELVDAAVPPSVLAPIKQTIVEVEGVKGCHRMRGRKAGSFLYLDVHIEVDPFLSVSAAHDIGETVRHQIQKRHNQVDEVFIHIDPSFSHCSSVSNKRKNFKGKEIQNSDIVARKQDVEAIVSEILSSRFSEKMTLEHITCHSLQGKVFLQVHVSMPHEILIRDAAGIAKEAEKVILKADSSINKVTLELSLGDPIPRLHEPVSCKEETLKSQH